MAEAHFALVDGLADGDPRNVTICVEAITEIAKIEPAAIAPHASALVKVLSNQAPKARWEAMHALALIAPLVPKTIEALLGKLAAFIRQDKSVIMRDYAVDTVAGYALTGPRAAKKALPILKIALTLWDGKHCARTLRGLAAIAEAVPAVAPAARRLAASFVTNRKAGIRKAASKLSRA